MSDVIGLPELAAILGFGGVGCSIVWALFRGRTLMLAIQCLGSILFALHWWLLGAETATVMTVVSIVQLAAAIPLGTRAGFRYVYLATLPVIAVLLAMTWSGVPSLLASIGTAVLSIGRYQQDPIRLRLVILAATPFWFPHNLLMGSYPAMTSDLLGAAINAVVTYRILVAEKRPHAAPLAQAA